MNFFIILLSLIVSLTYASPLDEVDLTGGLGNGLKSFEVSKIVEPSNTTVIENSKNKTIIKLVIVKEDGTSFEIPSPKLDINCRLGSASGKFHSKYYQIKDRRVYEISTKIKCNWTNILSFNERSQEGQLLYIFYILERSVKKLQQANSIGFWKKRITIRWPAEGDYYTWNTVHITKGYHWDVVGHELGHAIYSQAKIGAMGGGSHRIDECYSSELALSEGWASFFSAWISLSREDRDAKFEYLVPRRAPIRFENIPLDVCAGQDNEWRVTGFFWDLYDRSNDQEESNISFAEILKNGLKKRFRQTKSYALEIVQSGFDPILMNALWKNNFLTEL